MYRDRHYSSKCHVNHNCIYVACTGTDITIRYAMYAILQSKTWGMYTGTDITVTLNVFQLSSF